MTGSLPWPDAAADRPSYAFSRPYHRSGPSGPVAGPSALLRAPPVTVVPSAALIDRPREVLTHSVRRSRRIGPPRMPRRHATGF
ncbi:hypothetical protein [Streptomyces sp. NPDC047071]|uniref:hypothetical protein n=1 Tax=Streptomyces sp. NPDC047071 TaxID=3154808 RepID=UPI0034535B78